MRWLAGEALFGLRGRFGQPSGGSLQPLAGALSGLFRFALKRSRPGFRAASRRYFIGYSGFVVGNPRPSGLRSLSLPWNDSRSVLAVKGPLRRAEGAPLTAPLRSKSHI